MDEHSHEHDHDHEHDDNHPPLDGRTDQAAASLAGALHASFRLLTVIMVLVGVAFLLTGFKSIQPNQKGVKKLFGRIIGTSGEGLAYVWPFPVGEIEVVKTQALNLKIDDFWMFEKPEDVGKPLNARQTDSEGLRPGMDGAALTGDQNLLHFRLTCNYFIDNPVHYVSNAGDAEELLRAVICQATIHAAAHRTGDGLIREPAEAFQEEIQRLAQEKLDAITCGITIRTYCWKTGTGRLKPFRVRPVQHSHRQGQGRQGQGDSRRGSNPERNSRQGKRRKTRIHPLAG